jgi:SsrA-binding protein
MSSKSGGRKANQSSGGVISNRRAFHEYHVIETFKAGLVLQGTEVKSIRAGKASLNEAYGRIERGEVYLFGMNITPYEHGTHYNHAPTRARKLLLTKGEIKKLVVKTQEKGLTLVPLRVYFDRCWVKVDIALCKGKQLHDKRATIADKDLKRDLERAKKDFNR